MTLKNTIKQFFLILLLILPIISCSSNSKIDGDLRISILKEDIENIQKLITQGASLNSKPKNAKQVVVRISMAQIAIILNKDWHQYVSEIKGYDPLQLAAAVGNLEILELLMKNNTSINYQPDPELPIEYSPALQVAREALALAESDEKEKYNKVIKFLLESGAKE